MRCRTVWFLLLIITYLPLLGCAQDQDESGEVLPHSTLKLDSLVQAEQKAYIMRHEKRASKAYEEAAQCFLQLFKDADDADPWKIFCGLRLLEVGIYVPQWGEPLVMNSGIAVQPIIDFLNEKFVGENENSKLHLRFRFAAGVCFSYLNQPVDALVEYEKALSFEGRILDCAPLKSWDIEDVLIPIPEELQDQNYGPNGPFVSLESVSTASEYMVYSQAAQRTYHGIVNMGTKNIDFRRDKNAKEKHIHIQQEVAKQMLARYPESSYVKEAVSIYLRDGEENANGIGIENKFQKSTNTKKYCDDNAVDFVLTSPIKADSEYDYMRILRHAFWAHVDTDSREQIVVGRVSNVLIVSKDTVNGQGNLNEHKKAELWFDKGVSLKSIQRNESLQSSFIIESHHQADVLFVADRKEEILHNIIVSAPGKEIKGIYELMVWICDAVNSSKYPFVIMFSGMVYDGHPEPFEKAMNHKFTYNFDSESVALKDFLIQSVYDCPVPYTLYFEEMKIPESLDIQKDYPQKDKAKVRCFMMKWNVVNQDGRLCSRKRKANSTK